MVERSPEIQEEIISRLSKGEPMAVICRDEHMPSDRAVRYWQEEDAEFASAIARAREHGFDAIAAECLEIADTPQIGEIVTEKADGSEETRQEDMLGHRKLRIETRLKLLAKWDPKRYGELVKLAGADGASPIEASISVTFRKADEASEG